MRGRRGARAAGAAAKLNQTKLHYAGAPFVARLKGYVSTHKLNYTTYTETKPTPRRGTSCRTIHRTAQRLCSQSRPCTQVWQKEPYISHKRAIYHLQKRPTDTCAAHSLARAGTRAPPPTNKGGGGEGWAGWAGKKHRRCPPHLLQPSPPHSPPHRAGQAAQVRMCDERDCS